MNKIYIRTILGFPAIHLENKESYRFEGLANVNICAPFFSLVRAAIVYLSGIKLLQF